MSIDAIHFCREYGNERRTIEQRAFRVLLQGIECPHSMSTVPQIWYAAQTTLVGHVLSVTSRTRLPTMRGVTLWQNIHRFCSLEQIAYFGMFRVHNTFSYIYKRTDSEEYLVQECKGM